MHYTPTRSVSQPIKVARMYTRSEWHFKLMLWSYLVLAGITLSTSDWLYFTFSFILISLVCYGESKRQLCEHYQNTIKQLQAQRVTDANIQAKE